MSDLHVDNDTPKATDADVKRCDADTPFRPQLTHGLDGGTQAAPKS